MVITCPKCSARYKLPREKIQGRGAKITCPRCTNVFVIFNEDADAPPVEGTPPPNVGAPPQEPNGGAPRPSPVVSPAAGAASSGGRPPLPTPVPSRPAVAWTGEDRTPAPVVPSAARVSGGATRAGPAIEDGATGSEERTVEFRVRADRLNFREVGIQTWKVKVGNIGLTYDFSDINTLKRYLDDKKVSQDDQISWDGKNWVRIGEVGDLDRFFIRVWTEAREKVATGETVAPRPGKNGPPRVAGPGSEGADVLAAAVAAAEDEVSGKSPTVGRASGQSVARAGATTQPSLKPLGSPGGRSGDVEAPNPYKVDLKKAGRTPKSSRPEPPAPRRSVGVYLSAAVLLAGAGLLWAALGTPGPGNRAEAGGDVAIQSAAGKPGKAPSSSLQKFRQRYEERLRQQREAAARQQEDVAAAEGPAEDERLTRIVPVIPKGAMGAGTARAEPPGASPAPRQGAPVRAVPSDLASSGRVMTVDQTAEDYGLMGAAAARRGDHAEAARQYELAVGLEGRSAEYRYQWGRSLAEIGRGSDAEVQLRKTVELDPKRSGVFKLLGEMALNRGDRAGARDFFQQYLDAAPQAPDAPAVRTRLAELK